MGIHLIIENIKTNMSSTSNKNEKIYSVAKKSTLVEAILTCNCIYGFEFYGMSDKKRGFVTFGLCYRIFSIVINIFFLILIFGFDFLEFYISIFNRNDTYPNVILIMKIVIGIIYGVDIVYNAFIKIPYQIKVRNLMKEEENSLPMTHAFPQAYPPAYLGIYPQIQKV